MPSNIYFWFCPCCTHTCRKQSLLMRLFPLCRLALIHVSETLTLSLHRLSRLFGVLWVFSVILDQITHSLRYHVVAIPNSSCKVENMDMTSNHNEQDSPSLTDLLWWLQQNTTRQCSSFLLLELPFVCFLSLVLLLPSLLYVNNHQSEY